VSSTSPINPADFVFIYCPLVAIRALTFPLILFNRPFTLEDFLGIFYWSGYWGGSWLRDRLLRSPATSNPPGPFPPSETTIGANAVIGGVVSAVNGNDHLSYVIGKVNATVGQVGYNAGYLRTIINNPPEGLTANPAWDFTYEPDAALTVSFVTPQLGLPLDLLEDWVVTLNTDPDLYQLKQTCIQVQLSQYGIASFVWGNNNAGLNVQGFSTEDYDLLLKSSAAFLECALYDALKLTRSVGVLSEFLAKRAAIVDAGFVAFEQGYGVGLVDGSYDNLTPFPFPTISITYQ